MNSDILLGLDDDSSLGFLRANRTAVDLRGAQLVYLGAR
jgi:hypothetical protein